MSFTQLEPSPILPQLRQATAASHERLEATVNIHSRLVDQSAYVELLQKFLGFYQPLEATLESIPGWQQWNINLPSRRKSQWLEQDLVTLGYRSEQIISLPRCKDLPEISTLAQGFGCAYVLEGSTLGSRHISQMLRNSQIPPEARRFFSGHGDQIIPLWKSFCTELEAFHQQHPDHTDPLLHAADQTFACLERWMAIPRS